MRAREAASGAGVPIYVDESGSLPAGAMTMAGVDIEAGNAARLLERFRGMTGLQGELKGSRTELLERAYFFELFERFGGRARVCIMQPPLDLRGPRPRDLDCYVALLDALVGDWLGDLGEGCADFVIDEGRYDAMVLEDVRQDVVRLLGHCGTARMVDSRRSPGVQIADVVANSFFSVAIGSRRSERIRQILDPFLASGLLRTRRVKTPPAPETASPALQGSAGLLRHRK